MAKNIRPYQGSSAKSVDRNGKPSAEVYSWMRRAEGLLNRVANVFGNPAGGNLGDNTINAEEVYEDGNRVLTVAGGLSLTGGFTHTPHDFGTLSTGTITPNPSEGLKQKVTVTGGITINPTTEVGDLELHVINGAGAAAPSFGAGFKQWVGDPFTTTTGHEFAVFIFGYGSKAAYLVKALQ